MATMRVQSSWGVRAPRNGGWQVASLGEGPEYGAQTVSEEVKYVPAHTMHVVEGSRWCLRRAKRCAFGERHASTTVLSTMPEGQWKSLRHWEDAAQRT